MTAPDDDLLALARRLDWRFLLPDPALNRVAHAGAVDGELLRALRHFSRELTPDPRPDCDLVVLVNPSMDTFRRAIGAAPAFYLELHRPRPLLRLAGRPPGAFLGAAAAAGFLAAAYWHYPSFETANRILPLAPSAPLLHALAKGRTGVATRAMLRGAHMWRASGLLARSVPCVSVAGHRP